MPTLYEASLIYQSFAELPKRKRYRVMVLLPFLDDPMAKMLIIQQLCRTRQDYTTLRNLPNSSEIIYDLFDKSLHWLTDKPTDFVFLNIHSGGYIFTLPDSRFSAITFGQLVELDSLFSRYMRTQREALMDSFLSELYTVTRSGTGDMRKVISSLPYPCRLDAFRMYAVIRQKVFTKFQHLFPHQEPSKKEASKPLDFTKIQDTTPLWHSLLFSLAETPAYQGMNAAKEANMWEALTYLDEKALQVAKQREKYENSL